MQAQVTDKMFKRNQDGDMSRLRRVENSPGDSLLCPDQASPGQARWTPLTASQHLGLDGNFLPDRDDTRGGHNVMITSLHS